MAARKAQRQPSTLRTADDSSLGYVAPRLPTDLVFGTIGSRGLRQYGGYVRDEFLPQLTGRQATRTYREMQDNSPTVGSILFAIIQSMREVTWRVEAASDAPKAMEAAEFVESLMEDLDQPWPDFINESLSMLPFGFAPHEIIYKRRNGKQKFDPNPPKGGKKYSSKFEDGKVGWAKLALRAQETVVKWFFDEDGDVTGLTQQPWFGGQLDVPIEKILLFRPSTHKGNPEGRSILRTAYRPWWFIKRLEEQEGICLERLSGVPEYRVPAALLDAANSGDPKAAAALEQFKRIVRNVRVDEQMGLVTPSDTFDNTDGTKSSVPMYEFRFAVPQQSRAGANFDVPINRHKLDIMTSVLADFLALGHGQSSRGSQTLGEAKIDLFMQAMEGWLESNAGVINEHGLPRLWKLNGLDEDVMPRITPDMPRRIDLDGLSNFILRLSQSGAQLFPDPELENYLREAADLPELSEDALNGMIDPDKNGGSPEDLQKMIAGMMGRRMIRKGYLGVRSGTRKRRG